MRRLAPVLLMLVGCRHAPPPEQRSEKVTARHVRVRVAGTSLFRAELHSTWALDNPTKEPITVRRWNLAATLHDHPLAEPESVPELTVPAGSKAEVTFIHALDLEAMQVRGMASYEASIAPEVRDQPRVKTEQLLKLPQLPGFRVAGLHVTKNPMSFDVELTLVFVNDNDFAVPIERFDGEVLLAGDRFAKFAAGPLTIGPGTPLSVPLQLTSSIARLNGLSRTALSSTEAISTDVKARMIIEARELPLASGSMIWPR